jgi:hypothetical protein
VGVNSEETFMGAGSDCSAIGLGLFNFSIDGVVRGAGTREVPEPGAFALFVAALGGMLIFRRRKTSTI